MSKTFEVDLKKVSPIKIAWLSLFYEMHVLCREYYRKTNDQTPWVIISNAEMAKEDPITAIEFYSQIKEAMKTQNNKRMMEIARDVKFISIYKKVSKETEKWLGKAIKEVEEGKTVPFPL